MPARKTASKAPKRGSLPPSSGVAEVTAALALLAEKSRRWVFNPLKSLTAARLTSALDAWTTGDIQAGATIFQTIAERDDRIKACREKREKALGRLGWSLMPTDPTAGQGTAEFDAQEAFLTDFFNGIEWRDGFNRSKRGRLSRMIDALQSAVSFEYSVHRLTWLPGSDGTLGLLAEAVPLRYFENRTGELRFDPTMTSTDGQAMNEADWLIHDGPGLLVPASILYYYKRDARVALALFVQRYGLPGVIGKTGAAPGSPQWDAMEKAVQGILGDGAGVIGTGGEILTLEANGTGVNPAQDAIAEANRAISILFHGGDLGTESNRTSEAGQGAALQIGAERRLTESDAEAVSETLNRLALQALRWKFGAAVVPACRFSLVVPDADGQTARLNAAQKLAALGARVDVEALADEADIELLDEAGARGPGRFLTEAELRARPRQPKDVTNPAEAGAGAMQAGNSWDESKHPRNPAGSDHGGEFAGRGNEEWNSKAARDAVFSAIDQAVANAERRTHDESMNARFDWTETGDNSFSADLVGVDTYVSISRKGQQWNAEHSDGELWRRESFKTLESAKQWAHKELLNDFVNKHGAPETSRDARDEMADVFEAFRPPNGIVIDRWVPSGMMNRTSSWYLEAADARDPQKKWKLSIRDHENFSVRHAEPDKAWIVESWSPSAVADALKKSWGWLEKKGASTIAANAAAPAGDFLAEAARMLGAPVENRAMLEAALRDLLAASDLPNARAIWETLKAQLPAFLVGDQGEQTDAWEAILTTAFFNGAQEVQA